MAKQRAPTPKPELLGPAAAANSIRSDWLAWRAHFRSLGAAGCRLQTALARDESLANETCKFCASSSSSSAFSLLGALGLARLVWGRRR